MQTITVQITQEKRAQGAQLIDIREDVEHRREHIQGAVSIPLSTIQTTGLLNIAPNTTLIFHCKSGMRTKQAEAQLAELAKQNGCKAFLLEKGIDGWKQAGLETVIDRSQPIDLMRQVQIAAGSLVLLGVLLGSLVHSGFYALSAFVGAGLVFAGVTGFCGMARLLAKMPWNK
ncbi:hypothetical protein A1D29_06695 [Pasteurellaceae bacterium Orientalotternb1]|nr:hypothetical protein A1D29_06695 [Pasteurellaceae bacterium Orientalotternb1]